MLAFKESLVFYTMFHSNPINQLIHFVFVPAIFWSVLVWLAHGPSIAIPQALPLLGERFKCVLPAGVVVRLARVACIALGGSHACCA